MADGLTYVGKRLARPDVSAKATGTAVYGADVTVPGMLAGHKDLEAYILCLRKTVETLKYENEQITQNMFARPDYMLEQIEMTDKALQKRKGGKFIKPN